MFTKIKLILKGGNSINNIPLGEIIDKDTIKINCNNKAMCDEYVELFNKIIPNSVINTECTKAGSYFNWRIILSIKKVRRFEISLMD